MDEEATVEGRGGGGGKSRGRVDLLGPASFENEKGRGSSSRRFWGEMGGDGMEGGGGGMDRKVKGEVGGKPEGRWAKGFGSLISSSSSLGNESSV